MTPERDHFTRTERIDEIDLRTWLVQALPRLSRHDTLTLSTQLFSFLARATHEGVLVEDPKREIVYMNPRLANWVGLRNGLPEHLSLDNCVAGVNPDTLDSRDMLEDRAEGHAFQMDWKTERGATVAMDMRFVPFRGVDGRYAGGMGLLRPSETVKADPSPVLETTPNPPVEPAEVSNSATGTIGHDFNNLMAVVLSNGELLQRRLGENPATDRLLANVLDASRQAGHLARRIVNQSRRGNATRQLLNLNEVIQELVGFQHYLVTQAVRIEMDTAAQLWHLCGDPAQLERVIVSLAANATEAMPHGGVLTVHTSNVALDEERALYSGNLQPGRYVLLEIRDTGCGIGPESVARIFEPYFSTKDAERGMGLTTVLRIVREHQGALDYRTRAGSGSCFSVYLPTPSIPKREADEDRPAKREVVVCGSDITLTGTTKRMLARLGYYPHVLQNVADLSKYCAKSRPCACVLMLLPETDARAQCQLVEELKKVMPEGHLLAIGSSHNPVTADELLLAGADSHLTVPFRLQDIAAKLGSVLELDRVESFGPSKNLDHRSGNG